VGQARRLIGRVLGASSSWDVIRGGWTEVAETRLSV